MSSRWGLKEGPVLSLGYRHVAPLGLNTSMHGISFHVLFYFHVYDTISVVRNARFEKILSDLVQPLNIILTNKRNCTVLSSFHVMV